MVVVECLINYDEPDKGLDWHFVNGYKNNTGIILTVVEHQLSMITTWRVGKVLRHMPMVEMMTRAMEKSEMILAGKEE